MNKNSIIKQITFFAIILLVATSCTKNKIGVWEKHWPTHPSVPDLEGAYACIPEDDNYFYPDDDAIYSEDKSCADLGYTKTRKLGNFNYLTNPESAYIPPKEGRLYANYSASGGGSGGGSGSLPSYCSDAYQVPQNIDYQWSTYCEGAYIYICGGYSQTSTEVQTYCSLWDSYTGSSSACIYCN